MPTEFQNFWIIIKRVIAKMVSVGPQGGPTLTIYYHLLPCIMQYLLIDLIHHTVKLKNFTMMRRRRGFSQEYCWLIDFKFASVIELVS
jgi:hypothetical protein